MRILKRFINISTRRTKIKNPLNVPEFIDVWIPGSNDELEEWAQLEISPINKKTILGFDIEWNPWNKSYSKASLVQLSGENSVALIQMRSFSTVPEKLTEILTSDDIVMV